MIEIRNGNGKGIELARHHSIEFTYRGGIACFVAGADVVGIMG